MSEPRSWTPIFGAARHAPTEVLENSLYLGGARAAYDSKLMASLGITHILSVCNEYSCREVPSTAAIAHHTINIEDAPQENLLIRLPEACQFIQKGIDDGGKVYVHCMMGISRSVSVVCAYLMKTRALSVEDALEYVRSKRSIAWPNYGFLKQLEVWSSCGYAPSVSNPVYIAWIRKHEEKYGMLSGSNSETTRIVDRLYIAEDLPQTTEPLAAFLRRNYVTHLLTLKPFQSISMSESIPDIERCHLDLEDGVPEEFVLKLPEAVEFIKRGIDENPHAVILVHSFSLTRICLVVCAYFMNDHSVDSAGALRLLALGPPVYSPTADFTSLISLYEACQCAPMPEHPEIRKFIEIRKEEEARKLRALG